MSDALRPIAGYEGRYAITIDGRVWSYPNASRSIGGWLKPYITKHGYFYVVLCKDSQTKAVSIHRLVAVEFLPPSPFKPHVNHIDGIKAHNHANNLEWCTPRENKRHAFDTGLTKMADSQRRASARNIIAWNVSKRKLTVGDGERVSDLLACGVSQTAIADYFQVSRGVIRRSIQQGTYING